MTDKTLGAYERHESPDYADGGVAAALIEKEAEKPTATDFANAEFARHPDGRTAMRSGPDLWKANVPGEFYNSWFGTGGDMAREGWSPVRECPGPEQHDDGLTLLLVQQQRDQATARAEKAEKERDTWKVRAGAAEPARDKWREVAKREQGMSDELARQLEATEASLREANGVVKSLRAAESRPLTPDAITDEMVRRAKAELEARAGGDYYLETLQAVLTAALTEPPARPEGAEEWEDWLIEAMPHEALTDQQIEDLANRVARRAGNITLARTLEAVSNPARRAAA